MLSKLSEKCQKCDKKDKCDKKRMEACAYLELEKEDINPLSNLQEAMASISQSLTQPLLIKHDYRDIKIAEDTIITIDLEDMKKQLECRFNPLENMLNWGG